MDNLYSSPMIVMSDHGFYRAEFKYLGPMLEGLRETLSVIPPIVDSVASAQYGSGKVRVGIARSNDRTIMFSALPYVRIETHFAASSDGLSVYAEFTKYAAANATYNWRPPHDMFRIVLCTTVAEGETANSYLCLISRLTNRTYALPLPNINEQGLICLGFTNTERNPFDAHAAALSRFHDSKWNTDWFNERKQAASRKLFRFGLDDSPVPVTAQTSLLEEGVSFETEHDAVISLCNTVSNSVFSFLEHAGL